jgi:hypothetical protein
MWLPTPPKLSDKVDQKLGVAPILSCKATGLRPVLCSLVSPFSRGVPGIHPVAPNDPSRPRGARQGVQPWSIALIDHTTQEGKPHLMTEIALLHTPNRGSGLTEPE